MQRGEPVALGFRARSGWASMVIVAGPAATATVVARRHVNLAGSGEPRTVQPYHAARSLPLAEAEKAIARAASLARQCAEAAIREAIGAQRDVARCGLGSEQTRNAPALAAIMASHTQLHTAEGRLFRASIAEAGAACGLHVVTAPERELYQRAAAALGVDELSLRRRVAAMGEGHGAPWREDEKLATVAALLSLAAE